MDVCIHMAWPWKADESDTGTEPVRASGTPWCRCPFCPDYISQWPQRGPGRRPFVSSRSPGNRDASFPSLPRPEAGFSRPKGGGCGGDSRAFGAETGSAGEEWAGGGQRASRGHWAPGPVGALGRARLRPDVPVRAGCVTVCERCWGCQPVAPACLIKNWGCGRR